VEFSEGKQDAAKFAVGAIERMKPLGITANPNNFTVWYAYLSKRDTSFVRHVDSMLSNKEPFDDDQCADLYAAVMRMDGAGKEGTREAAIDAVGGELERAIAETTEVLKKAGLETERYGETLQDVGGALQTAGTAEQLQSVVANLVEQTRDMVAQNKTANERLQESNNEIADLKIRMADIRSEALTDPLTGLANRRAFSEQLTDGMAEATEAKKPLCLLMLDIDHFKTFNDTYGHQLGDEVIRLVAAARNSPSYCPRPVWTMRQLSPIKFVSLSPVKGLSARHRVRPWARSRYRSGWRNSGPAIPKKIWLAGRTPPCTQRSVTGAIAPNLKPTSKTVRLRAASHNRIF
jgi:diguanylate cyclase